MRRFLVLAPLLVLALVRSTLTAQRITIPIPPQNRPELASPSPRPGSDEVQERARALFQAIVRDEPALARDFFYPSDAFIAMKGIEDPGALWDRIRARSTEPRLGTTRRRAVCAAGAGTTVLNGVLQTDLPDVRERHPRAHAELGADAARAELVGFELSRRRSWIRPREESNRLPYWSQRHNWLIYRVGDEERRFEVRTVLSWGDRWYITHLREFR